MGRSGDVIVQELQLRVEPAGRSVPATLIYEPAEPYEVKLFICGGEIVAWTFGRDLLVEGLWRPAGLGDVQVWPRCDGHKPDLLIGLSSEAGEATLAANRATVAAFVGRTKRVVPLGAESAWLDVDAAVEQLLAGEVA